METLEYLRDFAGTQLFLDISWSLCCWEILSKKFWEEILSIFAPHVFICTLHDRLVNENYDFWLSSLHQSFLSIFFTPQKPLDVLSEAPTSKLQPHKSHTTLKWISTVSPSSKTSNFHFIPQQKKCKTKRNF